MKRIALSLILPLCFLAQRSYASTEIITNCEIQDNGKLQWSAKENAKQVVYLVQQFRWNKWVSWDTLTGDELVDSATYSVSIRKYLHSGQNIFRVCAFAEGVEPKFSEKVFYSEKDNGDILKRVFLQSASDSLIEFKQQTFYQLFDKNGDIVRSGYGNSFSRKGLDPGTYYLNYDNKTAPVMWSAKID